MAILKPYFHEIVFGDEESWQRFFPPKIKASGRITSGPIEDLVEDSSNLVNRGDVEIRLNLWKANFLEMKVSDGYEPNQIKSAHGNYITGRRSFFETVEKYLASHDMYLAEVKIDSDWVRGLALNGWSSCRMVGCLYERK